jgi:hypothetical protein
MRWPRMTTRRWFIVVAALAVLLALNNRRERFRRLADYHRYQAGVGRLRRIISVAPLRTEDFPSPLHLWHDEMTRKYERAAAYPWVPIGSDPPPPPEPPVLQVELSL